MSNQPESEPLFDSEPIVDEDEYEGEPITAQKVLENLQNAWLNEQLSPEILPHQTELLDMILGQIVHLEENIGELDKNDFRYIAHKMELDRIRYIVSSYLRHRLNKIETYTNYILKEESERSDDDKRLSEEETRFAVAFDSDIRNLFQKVALRHVPLNMQEDRAKELIKPNLMTHVFLKSNVSVSSVIIGSNQEEVDLIAGSQHIMPYQLISDLVVDGKAQLI